GRQRPRHGTSAGPTWHAYATERGPRVLRGQGRVHALVALGTAVAGRRGRERSDDGSRAAREQSRLVSRPADARVGRRRTRPARSVPRQGRAVRQARARDVAARRAPDSGARGRRRRVVVARPRVGRRAPEERVTRVAIVGAGSWGTAVAAIVADNAPTMLWARRVALAASIEAEHENPDYLPHIRLPESL